MNASDADPSARLIPSLADTVRICREAIATIPSDRRTRLDELARFVHARIGAGDVARAIFICTHNSRRSHMAQVWAQTAAAFHDVRGFEAFSGGTETTAFEPRAIDALRRAGFRIDEGTASSNPVHRVHFAPGAPPLEAFSKVYDEAPNPSHDFAAVMTCTSADEACPIVPGASVRVAIAYDDPKAADGTPHEAATYDERCHAIGVEMLYVFDRVRSLSPATGD